MTLKCWAASPLQLKPRHPAPSVETLLLDAHARSAGMTRPQRPHQQEHRSRGDDPASPSRPRSPRSSRSPRTDHHSSASASASPASASAVPSPGPSAGAVAVAGPRLRSLSSTWGTTDVAAALEANPDAFDMSATLPAPTLAMPAMWVTGRRRPVSRHGKCRRRGRAGSGGARHPPPSASSTSTTPTSSSTSSTLSSLSSTVSSSLSSSPTNTLSADEAARLNRRLRVVAPASSTLYVGGWERGQPADVRWEPLDQRVQFVRLDVCNEAWTVPTTIAHRVANDGAFRWRRVYWGMPIAEGYFVNVYDATAQTEAATGELPLLAQSERFAVVR